jgi:hypothetical protein
LFALVTLSGLATGMTMPSRDMIVRSATPPVLSARSSASSAPAFISWSNRADDLRPVLDHGQPQLCSSTSPLHDTRSRHRHFSA